METMDVMEVKWKMLLITLKTTVFQLKNNILMWGDNNNAKKITEIIKLVNLSVCPIAPVFTTDYNKVPFLLELMHRLGLFTGKVS